VFEGRRSISKQIIIIGIIIPDKISLKVLRLIHLTSQKFLNIEAFDFLFGYL